MPRYVIGATEVAVNPSNAEQVAPPGTLSPADAASKDALKEEIAKRGGGSPVSVSHVLIGAVVVGLGVMAYRDAKKKKSAKPSSGGHVIAGR